jgi:hypothetical protein
VDVRALGLQADQGLADDGKIAFSLRAHVLCELVPLMAMMDSFDGLFEADGDEEADDDGGDVDEEVAAGGGGVVRRVDVEHGSLSG